MEGKAFIVKVAGIGYLLYQLVIGDGNEIDIDKVLNNVQNAKEFAAVLHNHYGSLSLDRLSLVGGLLLFLFGDSREFTRNRTELKKRELEVELEETIRRKPNGD